MILMRKDLPKKLRSLVHEAVALLGHVIRREMGEDGFRKVERTRRRMKEYRGASGKKRLFLLRKTLDAFRPLKSTERYGIAHGYTLMLELINMCENAYRTFRLRRRKPARPGKTPDAIVLVLTAHPTESRSPESIALFREIQSVLIDAMEHGFGREKDRLYCLLRLAWHVPMSRRKKPSVDDESAHIASILFRREILRTLIRYTGEMAPVYVRTWVGGDKDGHPYVDETTMVKSLTRSRKRLLPFVRESLRETRQLLDLVGDGTGTFREVKKLLDAIRKAESELGGLERVGVGDGERVRKFKRRLGTIQQRHASLFGAVSPGLQELERLLEIFPGLVLPIELREASAVFRDAVKNPSDEAIVRMVRTLHKVSGKANPLAYARGLVVSMVERVEDIRAASTVLAKQLGGLRIPVIPLFETAEALENALSILEAFLSQSRVRGAAKKYWSNRIEVMVGYSDSSKEMGVLPSRHGIAKAMFRIDRILRRKKFRPVFFHGSGGSVERGGGSVREQTEWWPESAVRIFKTTVQGEMVQRSLATPEIFSSRIERIIQQVARRKKPHLSAPVREALEWFSGQVRKRYQERVQSELFLELVKQATPYPYLDLLNIGSRPIKRKGQLSLENLRAIPWILCWTQTRVLFPTWWGVGSAWKESDPACRKLLKRLYREDALFRSFVKLLGFTLAKVELPVWWMYLDASDLGKETVEVVFREFETEFGLASGFVRQVSGEKNLLWFRPWLGTSIRLRAPMIHPLNLLQTLSLETEDRNLLRETVTGIACGMLTTG